MLSYLAQENSISLYSSSSLLLLLLVLLLFIIIIIILHFVRVLPIILK